MNKYLSIIILFVLTACNASEEQILKSPYMDLGGAFTPAVSERTIVPDSSYFFDISRKIKMYVPANCFIDETGLPIKEKVQLTITRYDNLSSILAANLNTKSTLGMLETAGMLKIDARSEGNQVVKILPENPIVINYSSEEEGYQLFPGALSDSGMTWSAPIQPINYGLIPFKAYWIWLNEFSYHTPCDKKPYLAKNKTILDHIKSPLKKKIPFENPAVLLRLLALSNGVFGDMHPDLYYTRDHYLISDSCGTDTYFKDEVEEIKYTLGYLDSFEVDTFSLELLDSYLLKRLENEVSTIKKKSKPINLDFYTRTTNSELTEYKKAFCQKWKYDYFDFSNHKPIDSLAIADIINNDLSVNKRSINYSKYSTQLNQVLELLSPIAIPSFASPVEKLGWYNIDKLVGEQLTRKKLKITLLNAEDKTTCHVSLLLKERKVILSELADNSVCIFNEKLPEEKAILEQVD